MGRTAKVYIYSVIAAGGCVLAGALANWSSPDPLSWVIYLLLSVATAGVKLRLPRLDGTYSLGFLFLLYGVAHFSFPKALVAVCAAAVAGSLLNTKQRPSAVQVLFNAANQTVSMAVCFLVARVWLASGMTHYLPAVLAIVACVYFLISTTVVSGVLSLLQGKSLAEVSSQWYVWSFPYYLIGVVLVGLIPAPGSAVPGEAWLVLLPLVYLVHFFLSLVEWHSSSPATEEQPKGSMPRAARAFVVAVVTAGAILLLAAALDWQSQNPLRFVSYLALTVAASTLKVRLPRVGGTLTPAFVLLLAALADMTFSEIAVICAVSALVQMLWRPARRPRLAQLLFNPGSLLLSAALSYAISRVVLAPWLGHSIVGVLAVSTLVLYGSNSLLMATVLALVNRQPLSGVWQHCYFWSLPYYFVGAAAAGIMIATGRTAHWPPSLLVLPLMGLVYVSYRVHVRQAAGRLEQVPA